MNVTSTSAFGQDTIDALYWTATEPKGKKREHIGVAAHLLLAIGYVFLHALLVLLQVNKMFKVYLRTYLIDLVYFTLLTFLLCSNIVVSNE